MISPPSTSGVISMPCCSKNWMRIASGSLVLVRRYKAPQQIMVANPAFLDTCIHGIYPAHLIGNNLGCDVPGVMSVSLKLA